jgi:hypothetical protein
MTKERKLTPLQEAFLGALFSDEAKGDPAVAIKLAGYADGVQPSHVVPTLTDEIIERAKKYLAANSGKAIFSMFETMDKPASAGAMVKLKAATEILNRAGVKEKEQVQEMPNGIVILPAKNTTITVTEG